jgi:integrase
MPAIKITETVRSTMLRRPFKPSVTRDRDVPGLTLTVTTRRGFWSLVYQPRGINPATSRRWGGGVRHELGNAMTMTVDEARTAAMSAKALVRQGRSPHHEAMANRTAAIEERSNLPKSVDEALAAYTAALMNRRQPSERTRRAIIHYARKAVRAMQAESITLFEINARMIRLMIETMPGSDGERNLVFSNLSRFLSWCIKQELIEHNPCNSLDRDEHPKRGRARDHVPSIDEIKAVWEAANAESQRDLVRFLLLTPLRRNEASGLKWSEVDLQRGRICIEASRMKKREAHELPLSPAALKILGDRGPGAADGLVFPSVMVGKRYAGWDYLTNRIRKRIGQGEAAKAQRFNFHDIRRAFVSHLAEHGFDIDLLDQCLAHKRSGTLGVYQRASRMAERGRAMEAWAGLVTGAGEAESGRVVAFRTKT